jgi:hypothetical protein
VGPELARCVHRQDLIRVLFLNGHEFNQIYQYSRLALCFFCVLPTLVVIYLWANLFVAAALLMRYLGQNVLGVEGKLLKKRLRAKNTRTKTTVLAIIFRKPMPSVSPYLNPNISAET